MATITQTPDGTYRVQVRKKGYQTISKNFMHKSAAQTWARQIEVEMEKGIFVSTSEAECTTVGELLDRYEEEIAPGKKSFEDIKCRIRLLKSEFGTVTLAALTSSHIKAYRDQRLKTRMPETLRKELGVLNRVLTYAIKDCEIYLPRGNPMRNVRVPPKSRGRERRLSHGEEQKLLQAAQEYGGYLPNIVQFALETGMRRGEIARLQWRNVDLDKRIARALETKNTEDRAVPLSKKAVEILRQLPRDIAGKVFPMRADSITQAFDRCRERAGIADLRFHDLRHEATSRFFEKGLGVMEVAAIIGHKDLRMLLRYTHLRPEDLAKKLG